MNPARPYIIAELAQSHGGSIGQALLLMQAIAEAGATAVKFQDHRWEESPAEHPPSNDPLLDLGRDAETRFEYLERGQFRTEEWHWLRDKAHDLGLDFIVSPFSVDAARDLVDLVDCWKVASGQVLNHEMHTVMQHSGKPVLWSRGLSPELPKCRLNPIYFACTSTYPNPPKTWKVEDSAYEEGYSDHSEPGSTASVMALSLGAHYFERHVHPGAWTYHNDRLVSLDPGQFADYVRDLKNAWVALHEAETPDVEAMKGYFLK
jgi:N,N'-diacetyllegionaminate synthase